VSQPDQEARSAATPWWAAWPPRPPMDEEACPTCGYGLDDGSGTEHECPPGFLDTSSAASSYMLFDETGNALGSYGDIVEARVALRQIVEEYPDDADKLVLIGYDEAGMPTGEAETFADLPPYTVTVEESPWLA
jgi:hypothetical protein